MTVRELEAKAREHYLKRKGQPFAVTSWEQLLVWEKGMKPEPDVEVFIDEEGWIYGPPDSEGSMSCVGRCDYL